MPWILETKDQIHEQADVEGRKVNGNQHDSNTLMGYNDVRMRKREQNEAARYSADPPPFFPQRVPARGKEKQIVQSLRDELAGCQTKEPIFQPVPSNLYLPQCGWFDVSFFGT